MDLIDLYRDIEQLGFTLIVNDINYKGKDEIDYKEKQHELLHKIETDISCYKAILDKGD